ncbi:hypothetical protein LUZ60_012731 [Juncus effusus]|nr:hypothetical protein LUZ60_012731 [Juncus effusus]
MNHYAMRSPLATCEEVRSPYSDRRNPVFCPKPRRVGPVPAADPILPLRWHACYQTDLCDSKAGSDLLDMFLPKGEEPQSPVSSSPPFFIGSPPSRVSNPVIHDTRFGEDRPITPSPFTNQSGVAMSAMSPFSNQPFTNQSGVAMSAMSPRKVGCVRNVSKYGFQPAPVRVEGFDCLENRDGRQRGITVLA